MATSSVTAIQSFMDIPCDVQKKIACSFSNIQDIRHLLSSCKFLYTDFSVWPDHYIKELLSYRFSCSFHAFNRKSVDMDLLQRICRAIQAKAIHPSCSISSCCHHLEKLTSFMHEKEAHCLIPVEEVRFHDSHISLSTLNLVAKISAIRKITLSGWDRLIGDFNPGREFSIASVTSLQLTFFDISSTWSTSHSALLACFPKLRDLKIQHPVSNFRFIDQISRCPDVEQLEGALDLRSFTKKDFQKMADVFPSLKLKELFLRGCSAINELHLHKILTLSNVTRLDVSNTPISAKTLVEWLEHCPRVEVVDLSFCRGLNFLNNEADKRFDQVKELRIIGWQDRKRERDICKGLFPRATIYEREACGSLMLPALDVVLDEVI